MPQALPWITAIGGAAQTIGAVRDLFSSGSQKVPEAPPVLSWDQAMQQAQATLDPVYDRSLQDTLQQVRQQNIRSGFFGQLPGSRISEDAAARIEANRAAAIANLANQMVGQSMDHAARQQALAAQYALSQQGARQSLPGQFLQFATGVSNLAQTWPAQFNVPTLGQTLRAGETGLSATPVTPSQANLTPTFGNMGLANQATPYTLQPSFGGYGQRSFSNPYS